MRKIYVFLILLGLLAVAIFADSGWLNAQTEIQKSFNANSPGQNLQNQLLGSTNTNNGFLNLNGSNVSVLDSGNIHPVGVSEIVSISQSGTTTIEIPNNFPGSSVNWTYWAVATATSLSGIRFSVSYVSNDYLNFSIYIPSSLNLSPGTYNGLISVYGKNSGNDNNLWVGTVNLTIIYKEQSYVATATSYDASFCGVTGNVLTNSYTPFNGGVLLAKLTVTSNSTKITVSVSTGVNGGDLTSGISPSGLPNGMALKYSTSYNSSTQLLTLSGGSSGNYQHSGEVDIYASNSIGSWAAPGQTKIEFQFTITPSCNF